MKRKGYVSYLLRMWQTDDGQEHTWRASLECPASRERRGFATLDELFHFLRDQATSPPEQSGDDERRGACFDRAGRPPGPETGP